MGLDQGTKNEIRLQRFPSGGIGSRFLSVVALRDWHPYGQDRTVSERSHSDRCTALVVYGGASSASTAARDVTLA